MEREKTGESKEKREEKKETRERLLDAGERLLARMGAEGWSLEALAKEAGVSRVTVYRHFAKKESFFRALKEEREVEGSLDMRGKILQGARQVFGKAGFQAAKVEEIAEAAGVGVASVYRAFGDKTSLIEAFLQEMRPWEALLALEASSSGDLEADLRTFAMSLLRLLDEKREILNLFFIERLKEGSSMETRLPAPGRTFALLQEFFQEQLAKKRLAGGSAHDITVSFVGMIFGFAWLLPTMRGLPLREPEKTGDFLTRLFLHGLSTDSTDASGQDKQKGSR